MQTKYHRGYDVERVYLWWRWNNSRDCAFWCEKVFSIHQIWYVQLIKEIKQNGIAHWHQEIVNLAQGHYGMTMPHSCDSKPTNIDDVISII